MKITLDLAEKVIEIEGDKLSESSLNRLIDVIAERFIDFQPRILKKKELSTSDLFKKLMEELQ